jgi:hypothetical protein
VTHVETRRSSTEKISTPTPPCDRRKSIFAPRAQTNMILCMLLTQTHRSASTIVSHWFGPSVQKAKSSNRRVFGGNPDLRLYVIRAMPADNVPKAPIATKCDPVEIGKVFDTFFDSDLKVIQDGEVIFSGLDEYKAALVGDASNPGIVVDGCKTTVLSWYAEKAEISEDGRSFTLFANELSSPEFPFPSLGRKYTFAVTSENSRNCDKVKMTQVENIQALDSMPCGD